MSNEQRAMSGGPALRTSSRRATLALAAHRSVLVALCLATLLIGVAYSSMADEKGDSNEAKPQLAPMEIELAFRLVDAQVQPVPGAKAGLEAAYLVHPDSKTKLPDWFFYLESVSDASGMARIRARPAQFKSCCLVCRHIERHLVAVHPIDAERREGAADVTLVPECRVSGTLECKELAALSRGVGRTNVHLFSSKRITMECHSDDGTFHFFLPPGEFTALITGNDTLDVRRTWNVPAGQAELSLGVMAVRARPSALLAGKPAPELREVRAWKNSPGIKLAELRGKWVLLEFWGYWCAPCIGRMPELIALYDEYKDKGLEVIAVHCDGDGEVPVDTVEKLDEKLRDVIAQRWSGRDLPFPVALTTGLVPFFEGDEPKALGPISADYGISSYPSLVLIDPQGNVVGPVTMKELASYLGDK